MAGLSRFMAAFWLSQKTVEKVFFGQKLQQFTKFMANFRLNCNIKLKQLAKICCSNFLQ